MRFSFCFAPATIAAALVACSPSNNVDASGSDAADTVTASDTMSAPDTTDVTGDAEADAATSPTDAATCPSLPSPMTFVRSPAVAHPMDDTLRVNHIQSEATHNSYHLRGRVDLPEWNYEHAPLGEQLTNQGVRGLELDLQWDPRCRRFQVYHVPSLDDRSTCRYFTDCLLAIRTFSAANPGHHPLFIQVEPKGPEGAYDEAGFAQVEREILSVFDRSWIITPDEVRGASTTLAEAITTRGWPTLAQTRGRVLFYLDNTTTPRSIYTRGGRDLNDRLMFVDGTMGEPFAAVLVLNDPTSSATAIARALAANYLVRTRADSDPTTARMNTRTQLMAALASGAQIVSTDFPAPTMGTSYVVEIPTGTPSRCSPVTAPMGCTPAAIESPARLRP